MRAVSEAFLQAVRGSHAAPTTAVVVDAATGEETALHLHAGSVSADRTRSIRRTVQATLTDRDGTLTPDDATDLLAPFGNELRLTRGVTLPGGDELVTLGAFRLTDFTVADGPDGLTIGLAGSDRSLVVQRNRWTTPYSVAAGTDVEDAIAALVGARFPQVDVNLPTMGATTPKVTFDAGPSSDPWEDARSLARAAGWELSFDADGRLVATRPGTPTQPPAVVYAEGEEAVLLDLQRSVSTAASVYNGVIATGEGTGAVGVPYGQAWDDDPSSPTYSGWPDALGASAFGAVPLFYSSPLLTSDAQCETAARTRLDGLLGASEQVVWGQVVNPALEPDDVVTVTRDRAGLQAVPIVLDAVEIPLTPGDPMRANARRPFL